MNEDTLTLIPGVLARSAEFLSNVVPSKLQCLQLQPVRSLQRWDLHWLPEWHFLLQAWRMPHLWSWRFSRQQICNLWSHLQQLLSGGISWWRLLLLAMHWYWFQMHSMLVLARLSFMLPMPARLLLYGDIVRRLQQFNFRLQILYLRSVVCGMWTRIWFDQRLKYLYVLRWHLRPVLLGGWL